MDKRVSLEQFRCGDDTATFAKAMAYMKENPGSTLIIPRGEYTITSDLAKQQLDDVLQGRFGANPISIMFNHNYKHTKGVLIEGLKDCKIIGENALLMVDGFMEPVCISHCENFYMSGIRIDHKRKPYTRGTILSVSEPDEEGNSILEVETREEIFPGTPYSLRVMTFDPTTWTDYSWAIKVISHEYVDGHHAKAKVSGGKYAKPGMEFYSALTYHSRPAIHLEYSENVLLEDCTIHSQPGMGLVGNRCENVVVRRLSVVPSVGEHMSTNTDATHFTSMVGKLRLENCFIENSGDDFTNVHGYYHKAVKMDSPRIVYTKENSHEGTHTQSMDYPDVGGELELTEFYTLKVVDKYKVLSVELFEEERLVKMELDHDLPENMDPYMLADTGRMPELEVVGCNLINHFARGVLLKCRSTLIENNTFRHIHGPAIVAAAETWCQESIAPSNITIRNNRIISCGERFAEHDAGGITIKNSCHQHVVCETENVLIEDNIIECPNRNYGIYVENARNVTIRNNKYHTKVGGALLESCENVVIDE